jgi:hypothetical protein
MPCKANDIWVDVRMPVVCADAHVRSWVDKACGADWSRDVTVPGPPGLRQPFLAGGMPVDMACDALSVSGKEQAGTMQMAVWDAVATVGQRPEVVKKHKDMLDPLLDVPQLFNDVGNMTHNILELRQWVSMGWTPIDGVQDAPIDDVQEWVCCKGVKAWEGLRNRQCELLLHSEGERGAAGGADAAGGTCTTRAGVHGQHSKPKDDPTHLVYPQNSLCHQCCHHSWMPRGQPPDPEGQHVTNCESAATKDACG